MDGMRPPTDRDLAPLSQQSGVMVFGIGDLRHPVGEYNRFGEIFEPKDSFQPRLIVFLKDLPVRGLRFQPIDFFYVQAGVRGVTSTQWS